MLEMVRCKGLWTNVLHSEKNKAWRYGWVNCLPKLILSCLSQAMQLLLQVPPPLALPDLIFFADPLHFFHGWVISSVKLKCLFAQRVQQQCQHLNQMKKWWRNWRPASGSWSNCVFEMTTTYDQSEFDYLMCNNITGLFRWALSDRGFLQGRQAASSKNVGVIMINLIFNGQMHIHSSHLAWIPFSSGSKRLPNWKGFQKRTWGEIFTVRRLACGSNISNIYWSIYYFDFLQAPCEFSFVDIGPSKSKGVDHTQASGFLCSAFGSRICQRNLLLDY